MPVTIDLTDKTTKFLLDVARDILEDDDADETEPEYLIAMEEVSTALEVAGVKRP